MNRIDKIIAIVRYLKEEGMAAAAAAGPTNNTSGPVAGLPPDFPPVFKRKRKQYATGGRGSRVAWLNDVRRRNYPIT